MSNQGATPPPGNDDEDFFSSNAFEGGDVFDPDAASSDDAPGAARPQERPAPSKDAAAKEEPLRLVGEGSRARRTDDQAITKMIERSEQEISSRKRIERPEPDIVDPERISEEADERREAFATWILLALIGFLGAVGWATWQNNGVLDLRDPGTMVAIALGRTPPQAGVEITGSTGALPVERPGAPTEIPLIVQDLELARSQPVDDLELLFLEGHIRNTSTHGWRRIEVEVTGVDEDGEVHHRLRVPAGAVLTRSELATLRSPTRVERAYDDVRRRVAELAIQPGQQTRFSAVFLPHEGPSPQNLAWHAEIVGAQAQVDAACWVDSGQPLPVLQEAEPEAPEPSSPEAPEPSSPESDDAP